MSEAMKSFEDWSKDGWRVRDANCLGVPTLAATVGAGASLRCAAILAQMRDLLVLMEANNVAPSRKFLTAKEATDELGLPDKWLVEQTRKGVIPCLRVGRSTLYDLEACRAAVVAAMKAEPATEPDPTDESVDVLDLSVRASNCLENAEIYTLRELVTRTELDLLRLRSFGRTSLREVKRKLEERGLSLATEPAP